MGDDNKPLTITWDALMTAFALLRAGSNGFRDDHDDSVFDAPFRVPNPETGGGWVAVLYTQTVAPPSAPGPWRNYGGGGVGPKRILWVNERGEWGYSQHQPGTDSSLRSMGGSPEALRKSIRPVREIEGFQMIPEKYLQSGLVGNAEAGWPLERLVALARGDIEVDSPAMQYWR